MDYRCQQPFTNKMIIIKLTCIVYSQVYLHRCIWLNMAYRLHGNSSMLIVGGGVGGGRGLVAALSANTASFMI